MDKRDLQPLFRPKSIAVVGASDNEAIFRGRLFAAIVKGGYPGAVYPISPSHDEIFGIACLPSVEALPQPVDLAIVATPATSVCDIARACGEKGVRALMVVSSGFGDEHTADGTARQQELVAIAGTYGMALLGPNCEGFLDAATPLLASFSGAVSPNHEHSLAANPSTVGNVAVVSQSGGVGFGFYDRGRRNGVRFSHVVAAGNQASTDILDCVDHYLDDPDTDAIALFIEGLKAPEKLGPVADRAAALGKPIVVAKAGSSQAGAAAAQSHTGALAGSNKAYAAMFRHFGIQLAHDADQLVTMAGGLARFKHCLPKGRRVAILTPSGGAGVWLADICEENELEVHELDRSTRDALCELLPVYASTRNPVDLTAQGVIENGYARPLGILGSSPEVDAVIVMCTTINTHLFEADATILKDIVEKVGKPIVYCTYSAPNPAVTDLLAKAGIPCTPSMDNAARTIAALADYAEFVAHAATRKTPAGASTQAQRIGGTGDTICEFEAKALLARFGIGEQLGQLAKSADEAAEIISSMGHPAAMKIQSSAIPHKSDAGGVALNICDPAEAATTFERIYASAAQYSADAILDGVLIEPMAAGGVEMIVGSYLDRDFGPMVMVGFGGVLTEILRDTAMAPAPIGVEDAMRLIDGLGARKLLDGYRGSEAADVPALAKLVSDLSVFSVTHQDSISEIDLNPVFVHAQGNGVTLADAVFVRREGDAAEAESA